MNYSKQTLFSVALLALSAGMWIPWVLNVKVTNFPLDEQGNLKVSSGVNATALQRMLWNVTVWPKPRPLGTSVNVWWHKHIDHEIVHSPMYDADEYGQLHVLMVALGLETTETVVFYVYGHLWNGTRNEFLQVEAARIDLEEDNFSGPGIIGRAASITIPVPSDTFHFTVFAVDQYFEYTDCEVLLSFYLTPA